MPADENDHNSPSPPEPLAAAADALGAAVTGAGNRPIRLDDPDVVWFVEEGELDVFLVEEGDVLAGFKHVLRAGPGRLLFGLQAQSGQALTLIARGLPGSKLRRAPFAPLVERLAGDDLAQQVDAWIADLTGAVVEDISPRPWADRAIDDIDETPEVAAGEVVSSRSGVAWVAAAPVRASFVGTEEPEAGGTGLIPLAPSGWVKLQQAGRLSAVSSLALHADGRLFTALAEFNRLAIGAEHLNRRLLMADEANLQSDRIERRRRDEAGARRELFGVLGSERQDGGAGPALKAALERVGRHEGIRFRFPRPSPAQGDTAPLPDILRASGIRGRRVRLRADETWWRGDSGAMLAFREDGQPVALVPGVTGRYRMLDPESGRAVRVDAGVARELSPDAWFFYRPLPATAIGGREALRFLGANLSADLVRFAVVGAIAGALTLAPAVVVGVLANSALPAGAGGVMFQLAGMLAAVAVSVALLQMLQGTSLMRIEGRALSRIEAAIVDRVLGLPASFFRKYTAGDLANRIGIVQMMRDRISGAVANTAASVIFLLPSFALIFLYDTVLGWLSLVIGLLTLAVCFSVGLFLTAPQHRLLSSSRRLAGEMFQFIVGMRKLRLAGATASAFASWARKYRQGKQAEVRIGGLSAHLVAFSAALPAIASTALFGTTLWRGAEGTDTGDFLAVYVASMTFYLAISRFGGSVEALASIVPAGAQIEPILSAAPRSLPEGDVVTELGGDIRFDRVSFRYTEDGPLVVDDVSLHARPGEFVAIVGGSGAGKSTLLRLALGLEEPSGGVVYYDGSDLTWLNPRVVRRQVGVAMHDGALQPGSLLDNIIGSGDDLTIDDAWHAARLAAVDKDIAALPMGMHTVVGVGGAAFSGGQVQRIGIAAALARKPRIVFLDEATNWLDTESQAAVMAGIERLAATRIVIAHRLSTIRAANRIYVLHAGRVIQAGGFDELYETEGLFRDLVQRQIV